MTTQVITANRLQDGRVVYLTHAHQWAPSIADALLFEDDTSAQAAAEGAASVAARQVVDPYSIPVHRTDGRITPTRYREVIRAFGPSIAAGIAGQET